MNLCPQCAGDMEIGTALVSKDSRFEISRQSIVPCDMRVTADNMVLIPCFKCVECGCSVTLDHFVNEDKRSVDELYNHYLG